MSTSSSPRSSRNTTIIIVVAVLAVLALCVCVLAVLGLGGFLYYQQSGATVTEPAVEYILDASPRMSLTIEGSTRLEVARAVLAEVVRPADASVTAALRDFGSGAGSAPCSDTNLLVPMGLANQAQIADTAFGLQVGTASDSALAEAMLAAIKDLAASKGPHTLVVITGGADSCNAEAGELIKQEAERAGVKLEQFVVGLAIAADEAQAIKGLIDDTSGNYLDAPDADTLRNIMLAIQSHIDQPSTTSLTTIQAAATPGAVFSLPTAAPTNSSQPEATTRAPNGYVGQTACDHPYMPIRPGATWTYSTDSGQQTWTVDSVSGDTQSAVAAVIITIGEATITYSWNCSTAGIQIYQSMGLNTPDFSPVITITNESGVVLPSAELLVPGYGWDYAYTMSASAQIEGTSFTMTNAISGSNTVSSLQTTDTAFGSVEVLTVTGSDSTTISNSVLPSPTTINGTHTWQMAKGIGFLSSANNFDSGTSGIQLVSYNVP
jgi:hypothetical protein